MNKELKIKHYSKMISFLLIPVLIILEAIYINTDRLIFFLFALIVLLVISLSSAKWFNKCCFKNYLTDLEKRKEIYSFFSNKEMKNGLYHDAVIWLWWDLKEMYYKKNTQEDNDEDNNKEINALKLFICDDVHSIAIKKREQFQILCSDLAITDTQVERANLLEKKYVSICSEGNDELTSNRIALFKIKDKSLFMYCILIALHLLACFISDNFVENFLFYIPSDIIILLAYFNIINEKREK